MALQEVLSNHNPGRGKKIGWLGPFAFVAVLILIWQIAASANRVHLLPGPWGAVGGIVELVQHGLLVKYMVASLFRVSWGFALAAILAIPIGMIIRWALTKPLDCVMYSPLSPRKPDFDLVRDLMLETGVLNKKIAFEEYTDTRFSDAASTQTPWRYEAGIATAR